MAKERLSCERRHLDIDFLTTYFTFPSKRTFALKTSTSKYKYENLWFKYYVVIVPECTGGDQEDSHSSLVSSQLSHYFDRKTPIWSTKK